MFIIAIFSCSVNLFLMYRALLCLVYFLFQIQFVWHQCSLPALDTPLCVECLLPPFTLGLQRLWTPGASLTGSMQLDAVFLSILPISVF